MAWESTSGSAGRRQYGQHSQPLRLEVGSATTGRHERDRLGPTEPADDQGDEIKRLASEELVGMYNCCKAKEGEKDDSKCQRGVIAVEVVAGMRRRRHLLGSWEKRFRDMGSMCTGGDDFEMEYWMKIQLWQKTISQCAA